MTRLDEPTRAALDAYVRALLGQPLYVSRTLAAALGTACAEGGLTLGAFVRAGVLEGVCVRCALRMAGVVRTVAYSVPYDALHSAAVDALGGGGEAPPPPPVCCACYGALQDAGCHTVPTGWDGTGSPLATVAPPRSPGAPPPLLSTSMPDPPMTPWRPAPPTVRADPVSSSWLQPIVDYVVSSGWDLRTGLAVALHFEAPQGGAGAPAGAAAPAGASGKSQKGGAAADNTCLPLLERAYEVASERVLDRLLALATGGSASAPPPPPVTPDLARACLPRRSLLDVREALRVLVAQRLRCLATPAAPPGTALITVQQLQHGLAACGVAPQDLHAAASAASSLSGPSLVDKAYAGTPGAFMASAEVLASAWGVPLPPGPSTSADAAAAAAVESAAPPAAAPAATDPVAAICAHFGVASPEALFIDCGTGVSCLGFESADGRPYDASVVMDHVEAASSGSSSSEPGPVVWRGLSKPPPGWTPLRVSPVASLKLTLGVTLLAPPAPAAADVGAVAAIVTSNGEAVGEGDGADEGGGGGAAPPAKRPRLETPTALPASSSASLSHPAFSAGVRAGLTRFPLFFLGRYKKYARGVSQSLWVVEGKRMGCPVAVEHLSAWLVAAGLTAGEARAAIPRPLDVFTAGASSRSSGSELTLPPFPSFHVPSLTTPATAVDPMWATAPSGLVGGTPEQADAAEAALETLSARLQHAALASAAHAAPAWAAPTDAAAEAGAFTPADGATSSTLQVGGYHTWPTFHSAGREDVDVRMLGPGRPFVAEIANVRAGGLTLAALLRLQTDFVNAINAHAGGLLAISGLTPTTKEEFAALNAGAASKRKRYSAVCHTARPLSPDALRAALEGRGALAVTQWTPMRVLHRRPLLPRAKTVLDMSTEWIGPHYFVLHLVTSAGTYVKEFVHGDRGRTSPSVTELLGSDTDILQLDVTDLQEYGRGGSGGAGEGGESGEEDEDNGGGEE